MAFPQSLLRRSVFVLTLVLSLGALSGCRSSGVVAGEGPGIKGFTDGELNGNVYAPLDAAHSVVMQELVNLGVLNADEQRDSIMIEINARTLQEVPLRIRLSRISDDLTKVRIRAGEGDEQLARSLYGKVRHRLQLQFE